MGIFGRRKDTRGISASLVDGSSKRMPFSEVEFMLPFLFWSVRMEATSLVLLKAVERDIWKVKSITQEHALLYESLTSASVVTPIPTSHGRNAVWEI
ncbi:hypothetical protein D5086_002421 [Populus alba]|uniref:Uncharacterized protein n=1 Tax=Populus alba TaxID=43335 RepID=A0ACC4D1H9_POPAL